MTSCFLRPGSNAFVVVPVVNPGVGVGLGVGVAGVDLLLHCDAVGEQVSVLVRRRERGLRAGGMPSWLHLEIGIRRRGGAGLPAWVGRYHTVGPLRMTRMSRGLDAWSRRTAEGESRSILASARPQPKQCRR